MQYVVHKPDCPHDVEVVQVVQVANHCAFCNPWSGTAEQLKKVVKVGLVEIEAAFNEEFPFAGLRL